MTRTLEPKNISWRLRPRSPYSACESCEKPVLITPASRASSRCLPCVLFSPQWPEQPSLCWKKNVSKEERKVKKLIAAA